MLCPYATLHIVRYSPSVSLYSRLVLAQRIFLCSSTHCAVLSCYVSLYTLYDMSDTKIAYRVFVPRCLYQRVWVPGWEETNPFLIRFLMERVWNMPKPRLVFSVNSATFLRVSYALSGTDRIEFGFG